MLIFAPHVLYSMKSTYGKVRDWSLK